MEGGRGPGKGGERPRSLTWSEGSPARGRRAALEEDAYSRMKLVLRWYLSGFYKKPKVSAPAGEGWGATSGRSTQPLPAVGGEGHPPPPRIVPPGPQRWGAGPGLPTQGPAGGARPPRWSRSLKGLSWASTPQRNSCYTAVPRGGHRPLNLEEPWGPVGFGHKAPFEKEILGSDESRAPLAVVMGGAWGPTGPRILVPRLHCAGGETEAQRGEGKARSHRAVCKWDRVSPLFLGLSTF